MASSHIILPKEEEVEVEADHDSPAQRPFQAPAGEAAPATGKAALPFSATCVRISRDSYPNLRALRNASAVSIHDDDAAFVKLDEGDYGYVLDDVQHFTDYIPDLPVSPLSVLCASVVASFVVPDSALLGGKMGWITVLLVLGMVLGAGISIDPYAFSFGCAV